jgi:four helix bundle suffix protein
MPTTFTFIPKPEFRGELYRYGFHRKVIVLYRHMAEAGYKTLISYKLSLIAFTLGWDLVPRYYSKYEDSRQRDQIKQALRSNKQNIVEGCSERSTSSKLKLYDVAKASGMEALEDFEDILRMEQLPRWDKSDHRLQTLRQFFEGYPNPSISPTTSQPSLNLVCGALGGLEGKDGLEAAVNYLVDLLTRCGYMLDKQINAVEEKHIREGGYRENLLKKRLDYKKYS